MASGHHALDITTSRALLGDGMELYHNRLLMDTGLSWLLGSLSLSKKPDGSITFSASVSFPIGSSVTYYFDYR